MEHIKQAFDAIAKEYNAQRENIIPEIRLFYCAAIWAAEIRADVPVILDIGAGTGLLKRTHTAEIP